MQQDCISRFSIYIFLEDAIKRQLHTGKDQSFAGKIINNFHSFLFLFDFGNNSEEEVEEYEEGGDEEEQGHLEYVTFVTSRVF